MYISISPWPTVVVVLASTAEPELGTAQPQLVGNSRAKGMFIRWTFYEDVLQIKTNRMH